MIRHFDFEINLDDEQINYTSALKACAESNGMLYCALARYDSNKNSIPFFILFDINRLKALLHGTIFLATCNAILVLSDVNE